jgi:hypothetical protein
MSAGKKQIGDEKKPVNMMCSVKTLIMVPSELVQVVMLL